MILCPKVDGHGQINQTRGAGSGGSPQPTDFNVAASCLHVSFKGSGGQALKQGIALRLGGIVVQDGSR